MLILCYPKCSTCKKALKWLTDHQITFSERDIKQNNPTLEELTMWYTTNNIELNKFFNTSGLIYKDLKLKDKLPLMSDDEKLALLATDGMLVKRPLLIKDDGSIILGFKESEYSTIKN